MATGNYLKSNREIALVLRQLAADLSTEIPLADQVRDLLTDGSTMSANAIRDVLGRRASAIRLTIRDLAAAGTITHTPSGWRLS